MLGILMLLRQPAGWLNSSDSLKVSSTAEVLSVQQIAKMIEAHL